MADEGIFDRFSGKGIRGKNPKDLEFFWKKHGWVVFFGGRMHLWFFFGGDESLWNISTQESRTRCFFPSCGIVESSDDKEKLGNDVLFRVFHYVVFDRKIILLRRFSSLKTDETNKQIMLVRRFNRISFHGTLCKKHIPKIQQRMSILLKHKVEGSMTPTGGFLKWWYPTTIGFPAKNDHFGGGLGVPPFKETPNSNNALFLGDIP